MKLTFPYSKIGLVPHFSVTDAITELIWQQVCRKTAYFCQPVTTLTTMQQELGSPLWDEGISSYLYGEHARLQRPLTIDDLQGFATEWAVRIGDLLETLFLMAVDGAWTYTNAEGIEQLLNEAGLNELYAKGRLGKDDLKSFSGVWAPKQYS